MDIDAIRVEAIMQNIIDYLLGRIPWQENFDVNKDSDVDIADVVELIITP
ncbi:hypothetical protein JW926_08860 [Candidatus Sumerlaeota bacterium]|nr:hypothetical protein [Candidatus Sumerlaeota bacterium]